LTTIVIKGNYYYSVNYNQSINQSMCLFQEQAHKREIDTVIEKTDRLTL